MAYIILKHVGNQYRAFVDDIYMGPLYRSDLSSNDIPEEGDIPDSKVDAIKDIVYRRAANSSMIILSKREASKGDIESKLRLKGYTDETISRVVDMLYSYRYLDDRRFIESFIRSNMTKKSRSMIRKELSDKDMDMTMAEEILDEMLSENEIDSEDIIKDILERKFGGPGPKDEKEKRRIISYLARRGFKPGEVLKYLQ
ncbi:MAG: recombination regulator RecX [Eubacterium sp.]|nr:recombination regulator RecX [Eubacterium sp.]